MLCDYLDDMQGLRSRIKCINQTQFSPLLLTYATDLEIQRRRETSELSKTRHCFWSVSLPQLSPKALIKQCLLRFES